MSARIITAIRIADSANAVLQRVKAFDQQDQSNNDEWNMRAQIGINPMLLALSMELALKAWFVFDHDSSEVVKSHNLAKLFEGLKPESQDKLSFEFRQSVAPFHPGVFIEYEIIDILEHHKNAFVDWRYMHEAKLMSFDNSTFTATLEMVLGEFKKRYRTEKVLPMWPSI